MLTRARAALSLPAPQPDGAPQPVGDAGWLAALVVDRLGGTDDIPAWVRKSAEYYRLLQSENRDLRAGNESLRAECGLRQIQGYKAGKAERAAPQGAVEALREANDAVDLLASIYGLYVDGADVDEELDVCAGYCGKSDEATR